jgi:hypothetical protein
MQTNIFDGPKSQTTRLRAIVEVIGSEFFVYPIADSDADERQILDALRFIREDFKK